MLFLPQIPGEMAYELCPGMVHFWYAKHSAFKNHAYEVGDSFTIDIWRTHVYQTDAKQFASEREKAAVCDSCVARYRKE
jgi:hypothetical protein